MQKAPLAPERNAAETARHDSITRKPLLEGTPLACVLLLLGAGIVLGQASNYSQTTVDRTKRSAARVDPVTLGLNIDVPLGAYPGRAGTSMPVSMSYSPKLWTTKEIPGNDFTRMPDQIAAVYGNGSMQGWTSSMKVPQVVFTGKFQNYNGYGQPCDGCSAYPLYYIPRIHIYLPDGSAHELRKTDVPFTVEPVQQDWSGMYLAVDGSGLKYDANSKTLFLPDGSRYIIDGAPAPNDQNSYEYLSDQLRDDYYLTQPATYIDRSGNKLVYDPNTQKWTDTMGRAFGAQVPVVANAGAEYPHIANTLTEGNV